MFSFLCFFGFPPFTNLPTYFPVYFMYFRRDIVLLFLQLLYVRTSQVGAYHNSQIQCVRPASALTWWDERQTLWPLLTIIARNTLCVPASSVTFERSFSKTSHIMRSRRRRLSDGHVQELSFISWNADLLESQGCYRRWWLEEMASNLLGPFAL